MFCFILLSNFFLVKGASVFIVLWAENYVIFDISFLESSCIRAFREAFFTVTSFSSSCDGLNLGSAHLLVLYAAVKLVAVSWMVSVPLVFSSPRPTWVPIVEKYENVFTAMPKNLKCLPLICLSHSKLYFLTSKPLLPGQSSLSSSIYFYTLAQNLWLDS